MRKPIIAANWKMHKTMIEATAFIETVCQTALPYNRVEAVVCAPSLFLAELVSKARQSELKIGAQTMHSAEQGAFTGEISPVALKDLAVDYVIIGHSERRAQFNETDTTVNQKVVSAFQHDLCPIVCCGETLVQREAGETNTVVAQQVQMALRGIHATEMPQLVIAYEPIWAIGTGKSSTAEDANMVCGHIRETIAALYTADVAEAVRIQYGGSVNSNNIAEYMRMVHIDGALVGGASLEVESYVRLVEACAHE